MASSSSTRQRVVIVGAGFGGLAVAKRLANTDVDVTIVDKRNCHLFQPLLYQVATAGLSPADVAWPIRGIFANASNVRVVLSKVTGLDLDKRVVRSERLDIPYDMLVLATGSHHSYFGRDDWAMAAPGLKRIIDATEIRKRVLLAFELAEIAMTEVEKRKQLTFVIIGGGPTGVEMAGAIAELARHTLTRDFRNIMSDTARIMLVEAGDRLLRAFPANLATYAEEELRRLGVEVHVNQRVEVRGADMALIGSTLVPAATMIWAAGVAVPHLKDWLGAADCDRTGRVIVAEDLSVPSRPEIFVIGDAAAVKWRDGQFVPGIAPAAKQQGQHVAATIRARVANRKPPKAFVYRHRGNLATIGRHAAIVDFGRLQLKGGLAWWLWGIAHIYFLIGVRAPMLVATQWFWAYLTYGRGARLITGIAPLFEPAKERLPEDSKQ